MTSAIEPVGFLPPTTLLQDDLVAPPVARSSGPGFGEWFTSLVGQVDAKVAASEQNLQALAVGKADNLHQVMLSLEEARLSLQLVAQVRNKLLESYQEIMRMQM